MRNHFRVAALLLACLLFGLQLAGCGSAASTSDQNADTAAETTESVTDDTDETQAEDDAEDTTDDEEAEAEDDAETSDAEDTETEDDAESAADAETEDDAQTTADAADADDEDDADDSTTYELVDTGVGLRMMMETGMAELDPGDSGVTFLYSNSNIMIAGLREDFSMFEEYGYNIGEFSLEEYGDLIRQGNEREDPFVEDKYGNLYITYFNSANDDDFYYHSVIYKGSDAFWLVHFACYSEYWMLYEDEFQLLADTVTVD